ncbi:MAG: hypothetical protein NTV86_04975 [Planctomycetota bacterium]|nr:hypothetical protein [Planctomycetota bacterium]
MAHEYAREIYGLFQVLEQKGMPWIAAEIRQAIDDPDRVHPEPLDSYAQMEVALTVVRTYFVELPRMWSEVGGMLRTALRSNDLQVKVVVDGVEGSDYPFDREDMIRAEMLDRLIPGFPAERPREEGGSRGQE